MITEVQQQLKSLASTWLSTHEKTVRMQIETDMNLLKHKEGFSLALFDLISNPSLDEKIAFYLISTLKIEAKILFSNKKKSVIGKKVVIY